MDAYDGHDNCHANNDKRNMATRPHNLFIHYNMHGLFVFSNNCNGYEDSHSHMGRWWSIHNSDVSNRHLGLVFDKHIHSDYDFHFSCYMANYNLGRPNDKHNHYKHGC